ncbi:short chain dehydrogenase/reductase [Amniculicola lignicola CBS 123094]|uniref:Short-chain dehydrogenase/reductase 3 n=1 Tax=Amniculicola lignicola CBS 123094 TaxID=1392246 RepID=A0A6A5WLI5_9PLEO|nr:short chain dehydrogenase/reductase [Amniculicola lignicola CBS 123094]
MSCPVVKTNLVDDEPRQTFEPLLRKIPAQFPLHASIPQEDKWQSYITLDLIVRVLSYTFFHPWVSWVVVLCLRAQYTAYGAPEMRIATAWATLMSALGIWGLINERLAWGRAREVELEDEVIVVTGGVEGLGGLLARTWGMRGCNVAVLDKKVGGEGEGREGEGEQEGVRYYKCDVGDWESVERAAKRIGEDMGRVTVLVNNAGMVEGRSILESSAGDVERTFRTNTLSHFNTIRAFLPHMLAEKRGTIVTVSSVLGHLGAANLSAYTASKAALLAMHSSLVAELSQNPDAEDIKTLLVTPGQMRTKMFAGLQTPSSFLAPVVEPVDVAKEIITLVERGESGEIALPLYSKWVQVMSVLPVGVQMLVRRWSGVDTAMAKAGLVRGKGSVGEKRG